MCSLFSRSLLSESWFRILINTEPKTQANVNPLTLTALKQDDGTPTAKVSLFGSHLYVREIYSSAVRLDIRISLPDTIQGDSSVQIFLRESQGQLRQLVQNIHLRRHQQRSPQLTPPPTDEISSWCGQDLIHLTLLLATDFDKLHSYQWLVDSPVLFGPEAVLSTIEAGPFPPTHSWSSSMLLPQKTCPPSGFW
ncbi:hypothetical protein HHI36_017037 [Cryptolaemus montrouzieri]|uniref:Uncharacterized protein n=1 Tax=Cryptolaemus montrouzieri TaxID=559131 RepID=A0ABD2NLH8_9CUCU